MKIDKSSALPWYLYYLQASITVPKAKDDVLSRFTVDILEKQEWNWIVASLIQAISGLYSYIEVTSSWVLDIQEV